MSPEHSWPAPRLARALLAAGWREGTPARVQTITGLPWRVARHLCRVYGLSSSRQVRVLALADEAPVWRRPYDVDIGVPVCEYDPTAGGEPVWQWP